MKIPFRISIVVSLAVVVFSFVSLTPAMADSTLTPDQIQQIKTNCTQIKNTLNQLDISDTLLRVNRGQFYESMQSRLMEPFNTRLSNNSIDNGTFVAITSSYGAALNSFRTDFQNYDQKLSDTIAIDCTKQPGAFHASITDARTLRNKVHDDVVKLNQQVAAYQTAVSTFANSYNQVSAGVKQ